MGPELTDDIRSRLSSDHYGWLTTTASTGQPVPRLVWFLYDEAGKGLIVYTMPAAAKVRHILARPSASLNLDSDGNGGGIVVIGGRAVVDATDVDCRADKPYWAKYQADADQFGLTESMGSYSTRLRVSIDKVWGTPAG